MVIDLRRRYCREIKYRFVQCFYIVKPLKCELQADIEVSSSSEFLNVEVSVLLVAREFSVLIPVLNELNGLVQEILCGKRKRGTFCDRIAQCNVDGVPRQLTPACI